MPGAPAFIRKIEFLTRKMSVQLTFQLAQATSQSHAREDERQVWPNYYYLYALHTL